MKILITAEPRTGKSTLLKKIQSIFLNKKISGFITDEILEENKRVGFVSQDLTSGQTYMVAQKDFNSAHTVGSYFVDIISISALAEHCILDTQNILFIDEIGLMQSYSLGFKAKMIEIFSKDHEFSLSTIAFKDYDFTDFYKNNPKNILLNLTFENRAWIAEVIFYLYESRFLYKKLSSKQVIYFNKTISKFIYSNNKTLARKLVTKSLKYLLDNRIDKVNNNLFQVAGDHGNSVLKAEKCSCNCFVEHDSCSHFEAVQLFKRN